MSEDAVITLVATAIADLVVLGGWIAVAVVVWVLITARTRSLLAQLPEGKAEEPAGAVRWLLYGVALLFWPAALALGVYFLTKPETARAGRVCVALLLAYFTFSVLAAVAIVTVAAVMVPGLFG